MALQTRRTRMVDLLEMQHTNLRCLPENYNLRYYLYHYLSWPQLLNATHDYEGRCCGYVLAKLDDEEEEKKSHGHITSLATLQTHRKLGVASRVMKQSLSSMEETTNANFCSLHVRKTNDAALHLYQRSLQFRCAEMDWGYYVDGEDAYHMKKFLKGKPNPGAAVDEEGKLVFPSPEEIKAAQVAYDVAMRAAAAAAKAAAAGGGGGGKGAKGAAAAAAAAPAANAGGGGGKSKKGKK